MENKFNDLVFKAGLYRRLRDQQVELVLEAYRSMYKLVCDRNDASVYRFIDNLEHNLDKEILFFGQFDGK